MNSIVCPNCIIYTGTLHATAQSMLNDGTKYNVTHFWNTLSIQKKD